MELPVRSTVNNNLTPQLNDKMMTLGDFMAYYRRWTMTWNKLDDPSLIFPTESELCEFFNSNCAEAVFQLEAGKGTGRLHYQGRFKIKPNRVSKKSLMDLFTDHFKLDNRSLTGLTLDWEKDLDSSRYCTKCETRISGPHYCGISSYREVHGTKKFHTKPWHDELIRFIKDNEHDNLNLRQRKVIFVQDLEGGTGKSLFLRNMVAGYTNYKVHFGINDRVDRFTKGILEIFSKEDIDILGYDVTRTVDKDGPSLDALYQSTEMIKNGMLTSYWMGVPKTILFEPPMILIFSNEDLIQSGVVNKLSYDRWVYFKLTRDSNGNIELENCTDLINQIGNK